MSTIEKILDTAEGIVKNRSALELTLDQVAKVAKISKGGVLYHFPSKEKLLQALIDRLIARFDQVLEEKNREFPQDFVTAYVEACQKDSSFNVYYGLLAAVAHNPKLLSPLHNSYKKLQLKLDEASDPIKGALVRFTLDGLWISQILGLPVPKDSVLRALLKRLKEEAPAKRFVRKNIRQ